MRKLEISTSKIFIYITFLFSNQFLRAGPVVTKPLVTKEIDFNRLMLPHVRSYVYKCHQGIDHKDRKLLRNHLAPLVKAKTWPLSPLLLETIKITEYIQDITECNEAYFEIQKLVEEFFDSYTGDNGKYLLYAYEDIIALQLFLFELTISQENLDQIYGFEFSNKFYSQLDALIEKAKEIDAREIQSPSLGDLQSIRPVYELPNAEAYKIIVRNHSDRIKKLEELLEIEKGKIWY